MLLCGEETPLAYYIPEKLHNKIIMQITSPKYDGNLEGNVMLVLFHQQTRDLAPGLNQIKSHTKYQKVPIQKVQHVMKKSHIPKVFFIGITK